MQAVQVLIKKLAIEFDFLRDFVQLALPRIIFQLLTGKVGGGPCFAARSSKAFWRKGRKGPKQYTSKSSQRSGFWSSAHWKPSFLKALTTVVCRITSYDDFPDECACISHDGWLRKAMEKYDLVIQ